MKIKADLHNHFATIGSDINNFNEAIDAIRKKLGEGGICGLVNFEDKRYEAFSGLKGYEREDIGNAVYVPEKQVLVVKGQEVPTKQGHLLVLGLQKDVFLRKARSLEDTIKEARDNNGIIIADHPFYKCGIGNYLAKNEKPLEEIDAIEVYNGEANLYIPLITRIGTNTKAQVFYEFAKKYYPDLGSFVSSDGHSLYEIGSSWMKIPEPCLKNSETLTKSLRKGIKIPRSEGEEKRGKIVSYVGAVNHVLELVAHVPWKKIGK